MIRCLGVSAALLVLLGSAHARVHLAADLPVEPYLADPTRDVRKGNSSLIGGATRPSRPAMPAHKPAARPQLPREAPPSVKPLKPVAPVEQQKNPPPPHQSPQETAESPVAPTTTEHTDSDLSMQQLSPPVVGPQTDEPSVPFAFILFSLLTAVTAGAWHWRYTGNMVAAAEGAHASTATTPVRAHVMTAPARSSPQAAAFDSMAESVKAETAATARTNFPSQEEWVRRAGEVRNPVSSIVFGVQARANAKAMAADQERVKTVRAVLKEYTGMFKDLLEGQDAATAYSVRRDLAEEFYEHERGKHQDAFDETAHRRRLAGKRRDKEMIEADTRRIEASHEQEAAERFKDEKFQAGVARFRKKIQEHLVGAATAEAAIAEAKSPEKASDPGVNESAEVATLHALLQRTLQEIEEGERLGRDTEALRERLDLYKKLLNLS